MELKKNKIYWLIFGLFLLVFPILQIYATDYSSTNFVSKDPVLDLGASNATSTSFGIGQSFSQSVIGKSTSTNFQLFSGFQYFFKADTNALSATAGNNQVVLSWAVPATFLGVSVGAYEVGVGTVSGSYTFTSVGNVTSYVQTGLNNGTTYFFKIKAKTAGGTFLTFSNETSATPSGAGSGGGGGGGYSPSVLVFQGMAFPHSQVFLMKNVSVISSVVADINGNFTLSTNNVNPGSYQFLLYAKDVRGSRSALVPVTGTLSQNQSSEIKGIFIPPTLVLDKTEIKFGEILNFSGYAQANARVVFTISPLTNLNVSTLARPDGFFSLNINTTDLGLGNFFVRAKSSLQSMQSIFSDPERFKVGDRTVVKPEPGLCPQKGDVNSDCRVDLVDFSILAYWFQKIGYPEYMDFNTDGTIDLIDFSILMFYWQG